MSLVKVNSSYFDLLLKYLRALFCFAVSISANQNLHAQPLNEYEVKAVFIYNFTHFVKWPASSFQNSNSPFVIGVIGEKILPYMREAVEGEKVEGHRIEVKYLNDVNDVGTCHILFIENSSNPTVSKFITRLKHKPILTVSDLENFMEDQGQIRLYNDISKIRLEINHEKLIESNLEISSKLLSLATIYKSK